MNVLPPSRSHNSADLGALAQAAAQGDVNAAHSLLESTLPAMLRVVRQILGRQHPDVEDVLQDASSGLLEALPGFRGHSSVRHFACRVALLTALNARRRFQLVNRLTPSHPPSDFEQLASGAQPPAFVLEQRRRDVLLRLLNDLPRAQAEALAMHCVLGFTIAETADAVGAPANTVRGRLVSAKQTLRAALAQDFELEEQLRDWSRGAG